MSLGKGVRAQNPRGAKQLGWRDGSASVWPNEHDSETQTDTEFEVALKDRSSTWQISYVNRL